MKILSLGGSTSRQSINRQLANYVAKLIPNAEVTALDLNEFSLPIFSVDEEQDNGIGSDAQKFLDAIQSHDAIVISLAEHNGSYAAAFKNISDWTSRIDAKLWSNKPMLLLATSPGPRGGASVLESAKLSYPHMGADIKGSYSFPSFYDNFSGESGVTNESMGAELIALAKLI